MVDAYLLLSAGSLIGILHHVVLLVFLLDADQYLYRLLPDPRGH